MPSDSWPGLHAAVLWACAIASFGVFAVMLHSIATFRRESTPRRMGSAEILWALIPIIIVVAMAAPAIGTQVGPRDADMTAGQPRDQDRPELAGDLQRKAFHEGGIPL